MAALTKRVFVVMATVFLCSAFCWAQDIALDFQQALEMLPQQPKRPVGIMYYNAQDAANSFISKHSDTSAVEFLLGKIEDPNSGKLALLSLAKLAASNRAAENALYDVIHGKKRIVQRDAIIAIAYVDFNNARRIAETLLSQPGPWEVRKPAVDMLVGLGDGDTLQIFKQMQLDEENSVIKKALKSAVPELEYKLTKVPPDKQAEWAQQEILCWSTLRETPLPRKVGAENERAAKTLFMQGWRFSREFLEYKLNSGDLIGIAIIGNQKETWAVQGLKKYAMLKGSLGSFTRGTLVQIGTSEALRALEESLIPGGHSSANTHLMMILQHHGDKASAVFMKNLSMDKRFSERERSYFDYVYKAIEKRLSGIGGRSGRSR